MIDRMLRIKPLSGVFLGAVTLFTWVRGIRRGLTARHNLRWPDVPEPALWPPVSVIVPAWKERDTLDACLALLAANDYPDFEVIITAGGPDGTYESACKLAQDMPRVRVIEQQPKGKNAALNEALPHASGEVIVFLDADSQIGPGWLRTIVAALQDNVAAATGNYFALESTVFSLQGEMAKVLEYEVRGRVIVQGSGGIAVRRAVLDAIGSFPEGAYSSDWDLDARLDLGGFPRAFVPGAATYSHRPATWREWWKNELRWRRLHLSSLFRLKSAVLRDPVATAKHLYPYVVAWSVLATSVAWLLTLLLDRTHGHTVRAGAGQAWALVTGAVLAREMASVVEVLAYSRDARWLTVAAATPFLTGAGWAACVVASLTSGKATVHFKGPRAAARAQAVQPTGTEPARIREPLA
jgi:cellulose synthase/poly-beta-1,6-N-acetylglucosamine synthase-like glycosyltransferase